MKLFFIITLRKLNGVLTEKHLIGLKLKSKNTNYMTEITWVLSLVYLHLQKKKMSRNKKIIVRIANFNKYRTNNMKPAK